MKFKSEIEDAPKTPMLINQSFDLWGFFVCLTVVLLAVMFSGSNHK